MTRLFNRLSLTSLVALMALLSLFAGIAPQKAAAQSTSTFNSVSALKQYIADRMAQGEETDYLEAYLAFLELRAYPYDSRDLSADGRAAQHRDAMPPAQLANAAPAARAATSGVKANAVPQPTVRWEPLGPNNLPVPYRIYYGQGYIAGRVNAMAYDPSDSTSKTYYIATAGGGAFKTTDGGVNWTFLSGGPAWQFLQTSSVAVDPTNSQIVYVGTGDFDGYGNRSFGLMKSTDAGATWTVKGAAQFGGNCIHAIIVDPDNHNIITVATGRGPNGGGKVWRSTDGGDTFTAVINQNNVWYNLRLGVPDGANVRSMYVIGDGPTLMRSVDRGATWNPVTAPAASGRLDIATSIVDPHTLYLLTESDKKVRKSTNDGGTFTDTAFPTTANFGQGFYDFHIDCSKHTSGTTTSDVVYVGLIDIFQSPDGGATWRSVGGPTDSGNALTHNDQHSFAYNPSNPDEVLIGNDGGAYRLSFSADFSTPTYQNLNGHLNITQFYHADYHPTLMDEMLGGAQDNATPFSKNDLNNWFDVAGGDGFGCAINQATPTTQYASIQYEVLVRTTNEWSSSNEFEPDFGTDRKPFYSDLSLDPNSPNLLYAGTNYLNRWNETTQKWEQRLGNQDLTHGGEINVETVAPGDSSRIYTGSNDGALYMSKDAGATWTEIDSGVNSLPNRAITSIQCITPTDILVGLSGSGSGHIFNCPNTDGGAARTFNDISGSGTTGLPDISLNAIALDFTDPINTYFVGNDVGVFYTSNGGATWTNATAPLGLPNVQVNDLKTVPGTGYLDAATYGRGMWRLFINPPSNDHSAPTTTATLSPTAPDGTNGYYKSSVTITLTATDPDDTPTTSDVASTTYTVDGSIFVYNGPFVVSTDGPHTITFRSRDKAGNREAVTAMNTLTLKIDQTPPVTTAPVAGTKTAEGTYVNAARVTLAATDATSGVATTYYKIDGGATTTYVGPFTVSNPGTRRIAVWSVDNAGNMETARTTSVVIVPLAITQISPSNAIAGSAAFTLTVSGTGFLSGAKVMWNGSARPTTYVSSMQLRAAIPASDVAAVGTASVTVADPSPGNEVSNAATFTINPVPIPVVNNLVPSQTQAGGPSFVLTLAGSGFVSGSTVTFGAATGLLPSSIAADTISVKIPATLISRFGVAQVSVVNPNGVSSNAQNFTITPDPATVAKSHILWTQTDGSILLWSIDKNTGAVTQTPLSDPGFTARQIADGPNGNTRILWTRADGAADLWVVNSQSVVTSRHTYGPFANFAATAIAVGPDNRTRMLWNRTDGFAALWSVNTQDGSFTQNTYGPYANFAATSISVGIDNRTRMLWNRTDGFAALWSVDERDGSFTQNTYGPYPGWTAQMVAVGVDNHPRLLWARSDGRIALWSIDPRDGTFGQYQFGPYTGFTARAISVNVDNRTHILWVHPADGTIALWSVSPTDGTVTQFGYGPPSAGAQAISVSSYP